VSSNHPIPVSENCFPSRSVFVWGNI